MEISRSNFEDTLGEVSEAIAGSSFVALDLELTGLTNGTAVTAYDTPEEYYQKIRDGAMDFLPIQVGVCAFKIIEDEDTETFTHKAFNFYVFPKNNGRGSSDPRFLCQSSSIEFLAGHNFDFNKLFKDGIPYLNFEEEAKLRDLVDEKHKQQDLNSSFGSPSASLSSPHHVPVPEEHSKFIDGVCKKVSQFIKSTEKSLEIKNCNGFMRRLVFQTVGKKFPDIYLESKMCADSDRMIVATKIDQAARAEKEEEKRKLEKEEMEKASGFSKVIRMIGKQGIPVIGHNMLLDVCHMVHRFSEPLPSSYQDFKALVRTTFPSLVDTKLMGSTHPLKEHINSTVLSHLYNRMSEEPFSLPEVAPEEGKGYKTGKSQYHEAAFDAYVTGVSFIAMLQYLEKIGIPSKKKRGPLAQCPVLKPFLNKLFLMRVQDIPYIDLCEDDAVPPRDHVYHVTFPREWRTSDIMALFSPFGTVHVAYISSTEAWVGLHNRSNSGSVVETLTPKRECKVIAYEQYHKRNDKASVTDAAFVESTVLTKRKRSSLELEGAVTGPPKRRRSTSLGEQSFSKRSIEPIPEEKEEDDNLEKTPEKNGRKVFDEPSTWD